MEMLIFGVLLLVLSVGGAPLFCVIGAIALLAFQSADINSAAVIIELYRLADFPALLAIPLFTFAGYVLAESKAPRRLIAFTDALIGWMPGGLAIVTLLSTAVFTSFTGASGVTIVALGGIIYPSLIDRRYPENFSLGIVTTSGSLGLLFPPSLPIILYSLVAGISIDALFLAGFLPGVLIILVLALYSMRVGLKNNVGRPPFNLKNVWVTLKATSWEIPLPIMVIGGIYGGFITPAEAAPVTAFYVIIVEVFIRKDLNLFKDIPRITRESMVVVGAILIMLGASLGLTSYVIDQELPKTLFTFLSQYVPNKYVFLAILNVLLLGVNMIEVFSAIVIIVPIMIPIALGYGIDPLHLGIMFLLNLEIGYIIPPLALNIFLASIRLEKPLPVIYRAVVPFLVLLLLLLALITAIPALSLYLPSIARPQ